MINLLYLSTLLHVILGGYLLKKGNNSINRNFAFTMIGIAFWSLSNAFFQTSPTQEAMFFWAIMAYNIASLMLISLCLFSLAITRKRLNTKQWRLFLLISISSLLMVYIPGFVAKSVNIQDRTIETGPGLILLFFSYLYYLLYSLKVLYGTYQKSKGLDKLQLKYVGSGLALTIMIGLTSNIILPIFGIYELVTLGPIFSLILLSFSTYAIVRLRFLDTRLLFGKVFYFVVLALPTYTIFFLVASFFQSTFGDIYSTSSFLLGVPIAFIFVVGYTSLNNFLQSYTTTHLINPGYNPLEVVSSFRKEIGESLDIHFIVKKSIETLSRTIRPLAMGIHVRNYSEYKPVKNIIKIESADRRTLQKFLEIHKLVTIQLEYLSDLKEIHKIESKKINTLKKILKRGKVSVIVGIYDEEKVIGLLLVGKSETDVPYSLHEIEFIEDIVGIATVGINRAEIYEKLNNYNQNLQKEIDKATKELSQKYDELEETYRKEKDMLDILGHELRTPLSTSRNGFYQLMKHVEKGETSGPKIDKYREIIDENLHREIRLLETMLSTTKIDNDRINLVMIEVDVNRLVDQIVNAYQVSAKEKGLKLKKKLSKESLLVKADQDRLYEVIDNFVSNAIKYTPQGQVEVSTYIEKSKAVVRVDDTGEGIPEEHIPHLGKKFYRVNQHIEGKEESLEAITRPGGTGLGLYVSFGLVKLMKGKVKVESKVGKGSSFVVKIPLIKKK